MGPWDLPGKGATEKRLSAKQRKPYTKKRELRPFLQNRDKVKSEKKIVGKIRAQWTAKKGGQGNYGGKREKKRDK